MQMYEMARPDLMRGRKVLYVHGFASGGNNGTVASLRLLLPSAEIIAPDLPVEPSEAMTLLRSLCTSRQPDLVIGTSMGAMYAEQLHGFRRILVNPAFQLADTLLKNNGLGRQEYHCERADGETSFLVTKGLLESYRECSSHCFETCGTVDRDYPAEGDWSEEQNHVWGLFGIHDELVHTYDLFAEHYPHAIRFDGGHYLNDKAVINSLLPVIGWVDAELEAKPRKSVMFSLEDTLVDVRNGAAKGLAFEDMLPEGSGVKAFCHLAEKYDVYILASAPYNRPENWAALQKWTEKHIGVPVWNRLIVSNRKDLVMTDYIIDRYPERYGLRDALATVIAYGSPEFRTFEDITAFFDRLGGQ